jgi:hypothetical protein
MRKYSTRSLPVVKTRKSSGRKQPSRFSWCPCDGHFETLFERKVQRKVHCWRCGVTELIGKDAPLPKHKKVKGAPRPAARGGTRVW